MITLKTCTVQVKNQIGLYSRPASSLIAKANEFNCSIYIEYANRRANAKSLIGILSLKIMGGAEIKIITNGEDEEEAMNSIVDFIANIYNDFID